MPPPPSGTPPPNGLTRLRRRWEGGAFLSAYATGEPFEPVAVPIRGPRPGELATRLDQVRDWARRWSNAESLRVEYKKIGGGVGGPNATAYPAQMGDT